MNKLKAVIGITNKTEDEYYIPFLDFDKIDYPDLILNIGKLQQKFKLSSAFIISSTNGYNVFFLDKLLFNDCLYLCSNCYGVDENFIKYAKEKHNFTLRLGKDKKYLKRINSLYVNNQLSYAHYKFFNEFYKLDLLNGIQLTELKFDKLEKLELVMYMSKKYGYIEVD